MKHVKGLSGRSAAACAIFCALLIFSPGTGIASETRSSPWQGDVELGYQMTTGNTESRSLNAKIGIIYESARWRHGLGYETVYSYEKQEGTTAQRFLASGRTNYKIDTRNSVYGLALYENDRFSAYKYQVTVSTGYSRQIIMSDRVEWSAEIGPGYRYNNFRDDELSSQEEFIIHMGTLFIYRFTDTTSFKEELSVDAGDENTIIRSTSSLRVLLSESLSLRVSYLIRHVTDVPEETEKTDTETFVSLSYAF